MVAAETLYGRNAVLESLRAGRRQFAELDLAEGLGGDPRIDEIEAIAARFQIPTRERERREIDALCDANHQGVILRASGYPYVESGHLDSAPSAASIVLCLDQIEDPRNVGSLLRTAEAVGVDLVVIPSHHAASITPAVVNASAGAVEHLHVAIETNIARWIQQAKRAGYWAVGLQGDGTATNLFDADVPAPVVVVIGSEGKGMRRLVRESCDMLVQIPMYGRVESLNAAVAGSIALYQIREYSAVAES